MSREVIRDCMKVGELFQRSMTLRDDDTGLPLDLTGYAARLTLYVTDVPEVLTDADPELGLDGANENHVEIELSTTRTQTYAGLDIFEADLEIINPSGETEFNLLLELSVERRGK